MAYDSELEEVFETLLGLFRFSPTDHQYKALYQFAAFYTHKDAGKVFILKGTAGTGKTTLIQVMSRFLGKSNHDVVMLAPTGRAAKVITSKTRKYASTIHRHIFENLELPSGRMLFERKSNQDAQGTWYIVDEASMVGDQDGGFDPVSGITNPSLLGELFTYVFAHREDTRLVLVGDPAQLPPIGSENSPALNEIYLKQKFNYNILKASLTEVKRQALESGILAGATLLRASLDAESGVPPCLADLGPDVQVLESGSDALEMYITEYSKESMDEIVMISYSNSMAVQINKAVRARMYDEPGPVTEGDLLMIVKNNYSFAHRKMPFIANGEMCRVVKVFRETEEVVYGCRFCSVILAFEDLKGETVEIECKIFLDLLESKDPMISRDKIQNIISGIRTSSEKKVNEKKDPYLNALQVKFGYCVTGHKSQGGQWKKVILVFEPRYPQVSMKEYLRWSYTVFTRAEEKLYMLNCPFLEPMSLPTLQETPRFVFKEVLLSEDNFDAEDLHLLKRYGRQMIDLLNGKISADTEARKHMIRVANAEADPETEAELALINYLEVYEENLKTP